MNTQLIPLGATLLAFVAPISRASGESPTKPLMRDAATHEQLSSSLRKTSQHDPMKAFKPVSGADPSVENRPQDLISRSEVLCFNGLATLVPKRAVLQIPKNLGDRVKFQDGSKLKTWSAFYAANRSWITTVEVSRVQAEGKAALAEDTQVQMVKTGNLVIATYQGNPISVLPLKIPEQAAVGTNPKTTRP